MQRFQFEVIRLTSDNLVHLVFAADAVHGMYPAVELCAGTLRVLVSPDTPDRGRGPSPRANRDPRGTPNPGTVKRWVEKNEQWSRSRMPNRFAVPTAYSVRTTMKRRRYTVVIRSRQLCKVLCIYVSDVKVLSNTYR